MIFVVDDDARIRSTTAAALRSLGHEVCEFSGGVAALAQIDDTPPQLILSDVLMPEMDGPTFVKEALLRQPDCRVHYMSGDVGDHSPEALAPWPLLAKPFTASTLQKAVASMLC